MSSGPKPHIARPGGCAVVIGETAAARKAAETDGGRTHLKRRYRYVCRIKPYLLYRRDADFRISHPSPRLRLGRRRRHSGDDAPTGGEAARGGWKPHNTALGRGLDQVCRPSRLAFSELEGRSFSGRGDTAVAVDRCLSQGSLKARLDVKRAATAHPMLPGVAGRSRIRSNRCTDWIATLERAR